MSRIAKLLPPRIRDKPEFKALADSIHALFENEVSIYPRQISNLRTPKLIEKEFLSLLGGVLGFNIDTHFFSEGDYRRFLDLLTTYYNQSGTKALPKFISYTNRSIFRYDARWTTDYKKFFPLPGGTTIYEGGDWLITPHVDVVYDGTKTNMVFHEVEELFYELSPIHLVMEGLVRAFILDDKQFYIGGGSKTREHHLDWGEGLKSNFYASAASLDYGKFLFEGEDVFDLLHLKIAVDALTETTWNVTSNLNLPIITLNELVQPLKIAVDVWTVSDHFFESNTVSADPPAHLIIGGMGTIHNRIYMSATV